MRAAAVYLSTQGASEGHFVVRIDADDEVYEIRCRLWPAGLPRAPARPDGLQLSPLEAKILGVLSRDEFTPTREIAAKIDEPPDGDIRVVLRNLADREILECVQSKGYRLAINPNRPE